MEFIKTIWLAIVSFYKTEDEMIGLHLEDFVKMILKPFIVTYVLGTYANEYKCKFVNAISPELPSFEVGKF